MDIVDSPRRAGGTSSSSQDVAPPPHRPVHDLLPIAVIAALPRELAPFARALGLVQRTAINGIIVQQSPAGVKGAPVLAASAGMGAGRVALAVEAALHFGPVGALVSVGFAGACDPLWVPGRVLQASVIVDTRTGERFSTDPRLAPDVPVILATGPAIAGPQEKHRLRQTYGAAAVDMEAATVARMARARAVPFSAIKAISDSVEDDLTPLSAFTGSHGEFRTAVFALHTALRPARWHAATVLGRNSKAALTSLTSALLALIAEWQTSLG